MFRNAEAEQHQDCPVPGCNCFTCHLVRQEQENSKHLPVSELVLSLRKSKKLVDLSCIVMENAMAISNGNVDELMELKDKCLEFGLVNYANVVQFFIDAKHTMDSFKPLLKEEWLKNPETEERKSMPEPETLFAEKPNA